jgi:hypothetical protein
MNLAACRIACLSAQIHECDINVKTVVSLIMWSSACLEKLCNFFLIILNVLNILQ